MWMWNVEATAFLRGMVRTLVGTMVWVATGRLTLEAFEQMILAGDRSRAAPPVPPNGLCLMQVLY